MDQRESFYFAWEGASALEGPWRHLLVLEAQGVEGLNTLYHYDIELVQAEGTPEVVVTELLASRATLRVRTLTEPGWRLVHGIIEEVEQLGVEGQARFRVRLASPLVRASMMRKSLVFVDKTLFHILDQTMRRASLGMGLSPAQEDPTPVDEELSSYQGFRASFAWRCMEHIRISDPRVRPYCVQYEESDVDFLSRLLEEEGISYHFEHTADECVLVLSDHDRGKHDMIEQLSLGPSELHREVRHMRLGGRVRPSNVALSDYDWEKPDLDLLALSPEGVTPFTTMEHPGRYRYSKEQGEALAERREQQLDSERLFASFESGARVLSAGTSFRIEHPTDRFSGTYLVRRMRVSISQKASFGAARSDEPSYLARVEALWCAPPGEEPKSRYRPAFVTRRPRIAGSQTAVVTAEPAQEQEINVGGPSDLGSVRLRFHWDRDVGRHDVEATSCWIRVSQTFAGGRGHGAMFHPRVGDEVIVDFLDGDPDRPIIVGRVYNGRNLAPENATERPTYSCIKSMTSPFDGNFNMLAFDDLQGEEKFVVHAARDYIEEILHNSSRSVANFCSIKVFGDQEVWVKGTQKFEVVSDQQFVFGANQSTDIVGDQKTTIAGNQTWVVSRNLGAVVVGTSTETVLGPKLESSQLHHSKAAVSDLVEAPIILRQGTAITDSATMITLVGTTVVIQGAGAVEVMGGQVNVKGGASVNITGGSVNLTGGSVNLNC